MRIRAIVLRRIVLVGVLAAGLLVLPLAGPAAAKPTTLSGATTLFTVMTGAQENPAADPDGFGIAIVRVNPSTGQICYLLAVARIAPATLAHIHRGPRGVNGPVVVPLEAPTSGFAADCTTAAPALAADIAGRPNQYYVNVHNANFPGGAVRGQLHR